MDLEWIEEEEEEEEIIDIENDKGLRYLDLIGDIIKMNKKYKISMKETLITLNRIDLFKYFDKGYF